MRAAAQTDRLAELYRQAAGETAKGSKSFYFATRFFPADLAQAAHAVYWFCRYTDDLVDECESVENGRRDLEQWTAALRDAHASGRTSHPVLEVFLDAARRYDIQLAYAFELIDGMRMDLDLARYQNFGELRVFCYRVASVVGLMMCSVIGLRKAADEERARQHAIDLGIAMQLTNILRDIGEDLARNRIYLPAEDMSRFGYSEGDLREHVRDDRFLALMASQVSRARDYYARGNAGIQMLNARGRFAVKIASDVYGEILTQLERSQFDVFEKRAIVPAGRKYWLTAKSMTAPIVRHSAAKLAFWRV